ncbi:hypothetical protein F1880_010105 [Penicillium rolfsii]|nr:hypothetical protein F1880_010105 [Penicillium rolfsii]
MSTRTAPPTTATSFDTFSANISSSGVMTSSTSTNNKSTHGLVDGMPPAPPPSPVSFAVSSNGGTFLHMEQIVRLSLE